MLKEIKEYEPGVALPHIEFQLINQEEMMEIEKSPFGKYHNNYWRQESSIDAKSSR